MEIAVANERRRLPLGPVSWVVFPAFTGFYRVFVRLCVDYRQAQSLLLLLVVCLGGDLI